LSIQLVGSVIRDIVKLSKSSTAPFFRVASFNDTVSMLVHVTKSSSNFQFKQNAYRFKWFDSMLRASVQEVDVSVAAE
jgi:hypothetical protein